jgi:hypothetical protein
MKHVEVFMNEIIMEGQLVSNSSAMLSNSSASLRDGLDGSLDPTNKTLISFSLIAKNTQKTRFSKFSNDQVFVRRK